MFAPTLMIFLPLVLWDMYTFLVMIERNARLTHGQDSTLVRLAI